MNQGIDPQTKSVNRLKKPFDRRLIREFGLKPMRGATELLELRIDFQALGVIASIMEKRLVRFLGEFPGYVVAHPFFAATQDQAGGVGVGSVGGGPGKGRHFGGTQGMRERKNKENREAG